jgi:hypothetical protein
MPLDDSIVLGRRRVDKMLLSRIAIGVKRLKPTELSRGVQSLGEGRYFILGYWKTLSIGSIQDRCLQNRIREAEFNSCTGSALMNDPCVETGCVVFDSEEGRVVAREDKAAVRVEGGCLRSIQQEAVLRQLEWLVSRFTLNKELECSAPFGDTSANSSLRVPWNNLDT